MGEPFFLGIDQGTSGSKAAVIDRDGRVRGLGYRPLARLYPQPGRVEQEPGAVVAGVRGAIDEALASAGIRPNQLVGCGIASQRNTVFAWDADDGAPIGHAITWQDLRTTPLLDEARREFAFDEAWHRLGYPPGTYMGALHIAWRMRHDPAFQAAAQRGTLRLGLSAEYLIHALGRLRAHRMDTSLVQALGVYDFRAGRYWDAWRAWTGVPAEALPQPVPTLSDYGVLHLDGVAVPVVAQIGDQQAALFGQHCWAVGSAECTHGTASYVKVFVGPRAPVAERINVYHAWDLGDGPTFCLEAPTTVTGAAIRWMQDNLRLFGDHDELEALAASVPDAGGVVFVPALTGLEVPYHRPEARGTLFGLTLGHSRAHVVRAFLDAVGLQLRAILDTVAATSGVTVPELVVGGGVSASNVACQIQADLTGIPVVRPAMQQTTAYAAALLAAIGTCHWTSLAAVPPLPAAGTRFVPMRDSAERDALYNQWRRAIDLAMAWRDERVRE